MDTRKAHVAKVRPSTQLEEVDAEIAATKAEMAALQKTVDDSMMRIGDLGFMPNAAGQYAQTLIVQAQKRLDELGQRRIRAIAQVPEPPPAAVQTVSRRPRAWPPKRLELSIDSSASSSEATEAYRDRYANADAVVRELVGAFGADEAKGLFHASVMAMAANATTRGVLADAIQALVARIDELEARISDAPLRWCGSYQRAIDYGPGATVNHDGSMWVALRAVAPGELPGATPDAWQLAVRKGRDGKDAGATR